MTDPTGEAGQLAQPDLAPLESFEDALCLVMLGEPGIGKSTEFRRSCNTVPQEGEVRLSFDLKTFQTDRSLIEAVFENEDIRRWQSGSHRLTLFLDSLDEGRLEIRRIADILADRLQRMPEVSKRLQLRTACRTADWPKSLEAALESIWGEDQVQFIELVPLRARDVAAAARHEGIDATRFLREVEANDVVPFAITPVTLRFLLDEFKRSGRLPNSKVDLYERGCLYLCEEVNQGRRDAGHHGELGPAHRLEVAGRIAAFMLLTGRTQVDAPANTEHDPRSVSVSELAGSVERCGDDEITVTESAIRDVLSTALFSGRGSQCLGPAHWTYAEFLTARYLGRRDLDDEQIASLLFHPGDRSRVVPQLQEVAAWVAVQNGGVREWLLAGDPQALLRSDLGHADESLKRRLVDRLLAGFRDGMLDDSDWGLRRQYSKLNHAGLSAQLEPWAGDAEETNVVRRFAIEVLEHCRASDALPTLSRIALDPEDDSHIRSVAARAVVAIGDPNSLATLRPLAFGKAGPDPDDELRGRVLSELWSKGAITAAELFDALPRPQNSSFIGQYQVFLYRGLAKNLRPGDVPAALRWCATLRGKGRIDSAFQDCVAAVERKVLDHMERAEVRQAYSQYLAGFLPGPLPLPVTHDDFQNVEKSLREDVLQSIVHEDNRAICEQWLCRATLVRLLSQDDLGFLLERIRNASDGTLERAWAELAHDLFRRDHRHGLCEVLDLAESNETVRDVFAETIGPIRFGSALESRMREAYQRAREVDALEAKFDRERPRLDPSPEDRIRECLDRFEAGSLDAFWHLNRELQLEPDSRHYRHETQSQLVELPGWSTADVPTQVRILDAARRFLAEWHSQPGEWLVRHVHYYPDRAGYRALVLVHQLDPTFLDSLADERWANVAPCALGFHVFRAIGDQEDLQQQLIERIYREAPDAVLKALSRLLDQDNAGSKTGHLPVLSRVARCRDRRMTDFLLRKAFASGMKPTCAQTLIADALARDVGRLEPSVHQRFRSVRRRLRSTSLRAMRPARHLRKAVTAKRHARQCGLRHPDRRRHRRIARRSGSDRKRLKQLSTGLAVILWRAGSRRSRKLLWAIFENDRRFFQSAMLDAVSTHLALPESRDPLSENELADLFRLLSKVFPHRDDPVHEGAHRVSPDDRVRRYRDSLLTELRDRGTEAACHELEALAQEFPHFQAMPWILRDARRGMLGNTWKPLMTKNLRELLRRKSGRLVRSEFELQHAVMESLGRLQQRLRGETPSVRDLWDRVDKKKARWRPVDEEELSDYVARHLKIDLESKGIVSLREVQIRPTVRKGTGQRTDLYVIAVFKDAGAAIPEHVRVIVEVKGCWHAELETAQVSQLRDGYLAENDCDHGIYLVGWFLCDPWDSEDSRKRKVPSWPFEEVREFFAHQSREQSLPHAKLESCVLDARLP